VTVNLSTSDGGAVPPSTTVCLGSTCQLADQFRIAADGETAFTFALSAGSYPLTVRNAAPYAELTSTVTVSPGEATTVPLVLTLAPTPTPQPTQPAGSTPTPIVPTATAGPITNLPNTGGTDVPSSSQWGTGFAAGTLALMLLLTGLVLRRRRGIR
jgi:hypothetical protein